MHLIRFCDSESRILRASVVTEHNIFALRRMGGLVWVGARGDGQGLAGFLSVPHNVRLFNGLCQAELSWYVCVRLYVSTLLYLDHDMATIPYIISLTLSLSVRHLFEFTFMCPYLHFIANVYSPINSSILEWDTSITTIRAISRSVDAAASIRRGVVEDIHDDGM